MRTFVKVEIIGKDYQGYADSRFVMGHARNFAIARPKVFRLYQIRASQAYPISTFIFITSWKIVS